MAGTTLYRVIADPKRSLATGVFGLFPRGHRPRRVVEELFGSRDSFIAPAPMMTRVFRCTIYYLRIFRIDRPV